MSGRAVLLLTVYGVALVGWSAIWVAARHHPVILLGSLLAFAAGLYSDLKGRHLLPPSRNRMLLVLGLGLAVVDWRWLSGHWFLAIVSLMLYVSAVRALAPKANRDLMQMIGLALLQLLAASVLTASLAYGVFFLLFLVLVPWALLAVAVKGELEGESDILRGRVAEGGVLEAPPALGQVLRSGIAAPMVTAIVLTMAMTAAFFVAFPRLGQGVLPGTMSVDQPVSGLSDEVELGGMGTVLQDSTPALRAKWLEGQPPPLDDLYFRAVVLDNFDGRKWRNTLDGRSMHNHRGRFSFEPQWRERTTDRVKVLLEDLGSRLLPVLPGTLGVELSNRRLYRDFLGTIEQHRNGGAQRYEVRAAPQAYWREVDWADLERPQLTLRQSRLTRLPDNVKLPAAVTRYAGRQDYGWIPEAIETFLQYEYTLDLYEGRDKLLQFFEHEAGHCEMFATSLALMLRAAGLPAVVVNGFRGGESIDGEYVLVRQRNAHSWVETWHPDIGWVPLDPTPPAPGPSGLFGRMQERWQRTVDRMWFFWMDRIVDYDAALQRDAARSVRDQGRDVAGGLREWTASLQERYGRWVAWAVGGLITGGMLAMLVWLGRLRRPRRFGGLQALSYQRPWRAMARLLETAEAHYGGRPPGLPVAQWLRQLPADTAVTRLQALWHRYEQARFGRHAAERRALEQEARALRAVLRQTKR